MNATLADIASIFKDSKVLVLPHSNADPDGLGSALGLSLSIPNVEFGLVDGVNKSAKNMLDTFGIEAKPFILEDHDKILCVDSSVPQMLGDYAILADMDNVAVLDHHSPSEEWPNAVYHSDESKGSCAEQVYDLLKHMEIEPPRQAAIALMCGIYADTASFRYANHSALRAFLDLGEKHDVDVTDIVSMLATEIDMSERISHVKAAQRTKMLRTKELLLVSTRISAFEGSTARLLLGIGADVAFVGSQSKKKVRISGRARKSALNAGLHLGKIFEEVAQEIGGSGGGHDGAAGLNTTGDVEAVLHVCMEKTKELLS